MPPATSPDHGAVADQVPEAIEVTQTTIPMVATWIPAILHSLAYRLTEMGPVRMARAWLAVNQKTGFDCPSCAWADPDGSRHPFEFCENGAKAMADDAKSARVTPEFFARYSIAELSEKSDYWLNRPGRITHPMILRPGATHYEQISWDDSLQAIGMELNQLESPDEAVFYTSDKATNEAAFIYLWLLKIPNLRKGLEGFDSSAQYKLLQHCLKSSSLCQPVRLSTAACQPPYGGQPPCQPSTG